MHRSRVLLTTLALLLAATVAPGVAEAQQPRRVTGRVTDAASGEPLVGANVSVQGTALGATVGDQGTFALTVPDGRTTLLVRRIGYKRRALDVGPGDQQVAVALERDALRLEATVVTGAATSVDRRNAANDVGLVDAEQIGRVPAASLENALAGRVAGAQVIANSGAPGGGNQVRLRGVTSVFGSADPLYVVDGVIISNDIVQPGTNAISAANRNTSNATNQDNGVNRVADLNPNDIESIEVLKGASASAIYGSKASNGVIVIRTKRGDPGRTRLDVTQRFGTFDLAGRFGTRRYTLDQAIEYGANNGISADSVRANYARCGGYCDYEELLFGENPLSWETSVSMRGGSSERGSSYFASGLDKYDGGIQKNTGYRKQGLRLNLSQAVGPRLTLQLNNNVMRTMTRRGISNNDNANITPYFVMAGTPSWYDLRPSGGRYPANPFMVTNPFQNADQIETPLEVNRLISSGSASYAAYTGARQTLQLRVDGGVDRYGTQGNVVSPRSLFWEANDGLPGTVTSLSGNVLTANANLSALHTWTPASGSLRATTSAGVQREIAQGRSSNIVTRDVLLGQENVNRGSATSVFANRQEVRAFAVYGQEELLALDDRLLATAGARGERSTVNGDVDKYYWYPKASLSYRVLQPARFLDELKPRVAVGQSGNQPLFIQKYSPAFPGTYQGQNAVQAGLIHGNPNIKPERQTEVEGGVDATLFGGRASLALTAYQKTIEDVILHVTTAPSLGYVVDIRNAGAIRNRGTEVLLAVTPVQRAGVDWISRVTFARNVGVVTRLDLPEGQTFFNVERDANGERVAFGAGYGIGRLEVGKRVTQIVAQVTDTLTEQTRVVQRGDAAPDFTMGFGNEVGYRALRLSFLLDWQRGGDLVNVTQNVFDAFANSPDRTDGGAGRSRLNDALGISQYVQEAGFVKLREVTLGYDLPRALLARTLRSPSARVELSGRNLVTWSKYPGVDPEVSNFGSQQISRFVDLAPFPPSRSIFLSITASY
ncbi:MAG: SusC/RagA family TonB-linked outer membrane protein [Gemmatimonadaceae bacterium]